MSVLEYLQCYDLATCRYKSTWRRHTEQRAELASMLAECYACTGRLRQCSRELWRAYRRLEDYAKCVGLIDTEEKQGYGKLCEYTVYLKYESSKPSWSRHVEVRIYLPTPLHIPCEHELDKAELVAKEVADTWYGGMIDFQIEGKSGVRELQGNGDTWCNGSLRVSLNDPIVYEIHDYRGYHYELEKEGGWCSWEREDTLPSISP